MKALREMHQRMSKATRAQRPALMTEHMQAMQDGLAMMREMHAEMGAEIEARLSSDGIANGMNEGLPAGMAKRHQMMGDHMDTMQVMMDMMAERMPPAEASQ